VGERTGGVLTRSAVSSTRAWRDGSTRDDEIDHWTCVLELAAVGASCCAARRGTGARHSSMSTIPFAFQTRAAR